MSKDDKMNLFQLSNKISKILSQEYNKNKEDIKSTGSNNIKSTETEKENLKSYEFNLKPVELANYLKEYMLGQNEAIDIIATKICTHFNRMSYEKKNPELNQIINKVKSNILMIGPTGVGKTYMIKLIAHKLGVPFVKADATKFTETGYVGGDVEDLVRNLVNEAKGNINLAEYGIIYLDEIDKIAATNNSNGPDVSRKGVQHNLLKIMEESEVDLKNPMDISSQMETVIQAQQTGKTEKKKINTKNILFVMSGAFQDLTEIIKKRLKYNNLGFANIEDSKSKSNNTKANYLNNVQSEDLIEYGFESEFIGRLPIISVLNNLNEETLYKILENPKNTLINSKKRDFMSYGININFDNEAFKLISKEAYNGKTGARNLLNILEKKLIIFENYLPSTNIKKLEINKYLIENPKDYLSEIIIKEAIKIVSKDFKNKHGINISFTKDALEYIKTLSQDKLSESKIIINKCLENFEYGLKLAGQSELTIKRNMLENKEEYLDQLIKQTYKSTNKD